MKKTIPNTDTNLTPLALMDEIIDNAYYLVNTVNLLTGECEFYTMLGREVVYQFMNDTEGRKFYLSRTPIAFKADEYDS